MENSITLTAQQLYYIATLMNAEHIDYSYISAMGIIEDNYSVFESRVIGELVELGIVNEDFNGEVEIRSDIHGLLEPVFFGTAELTFDMCPTVSEGAMKCHHFHMLRDRIVMISNDDVRLNIVQADADSVMKAIKELLPEGYSSGKELVLQEVDKEKITRIISVKSIVSDKESLVEVFLEYAGRICKENDDGSLVSLDKDTFISDCVSVMQGVI